MPTSGARRAPDPVLPFAAISGIPGSLANTARQADDVQIGTDFAINKGRRSGYRRLDMGQQTGKQVP